MCTYVRCECLIDYRNSVDAEETSRIVVDLATGMETLA